MDTGAGLLPDWPESDPRTALAVVGSLRSLRWAIASARHGTPSSIDRAERELAARFGRGHAVATCNGSAAIVIALRALGIGPGARVLVPALTWVACASAVLRAGATPVFADSGAASPLPDLAAARRTSGRVDAVLAVHLYASRMPLEAVADAFPGVPVIEDFSHVHGGLDSRGRPIGAGGDISICSFQASKLLTCGEGGAAFTDDPGLAERLAALRADSRVRFSSGRAVEGVDLQAFSGVQGANYALSEASAALLRDQLARFDGQLARRAAGARWFAEAVRSRGFEVVADPDLLERGAFYRLPVVPPPGHATPEGLAACRRAVSAAAGFEIDQAYPPIPASPLYRPGTVPQFAGPGAAAPQADTPRASAWSARALVFQHELFLAPQPALAAVADALAEACARAPARPRPSRPRGAERLTVAVLTRGDRDSLPAAVASAAAQDYPGPVDLLVLGDGIASLADLPRLPWAPGRLTFLGVAGPDRDRDGGPVARVARLRNLAVAAVGTPLVAFLDDDNRWEPDHLSNLGACLGRHRALAAHSWRRLVGRDGARWGGGDFPWAPAGPTRDRMRARLASEGVIRPGDDVVRDRARLRDGSPGMVDLGAWLFRTEALRVVPFRTHYDAAERDDMVGEDDKLLSDLVAAGLDLPCTGRASLVYALGGLSNGAFALEAAQ